MNFIVVFLLITITVGGTIFVGKMFENILDHYFPGRSVPKLVFSIISFVIVFPLIVGAVLVLEIQLFKTDVSGVLPPATFTVEPEPSDTPVVEAQPIAPATPKPPTCLFINETLQKSMFIQWLDDPEGSEFWAGVQVVTQTTLSLPAEWIMHDEPTNTDKLGPLTIPRNTLVSIYTPYKCRPLDGPE